MANRGKFFYKGSDINDIIKTDPNAEEDPSKYVGLPDILSTNYNLYKRNADIGYQINGTDLGYGKSSYAYVVCNNSQRVHIPAEANKVRVIGVGGGGGGGGGGSGFSANSRNAGNRKAFAGYGGSGTAATLGYTDKNRSGNNIEIVIGDIGTGGTGNNQYSMNSNYNNKNRKGPDCSPGNAGTPTSFKFGNSNWTHYFKGGGGGAGGNGANGNAKYNSVDAVQDLPLASNGNRNTNHDDNQHSGNTDPGKAGDGGDGGPNGHDGQPGKIGNNGQAIVVFLTD